MTPNLADAPNAAMTPRFHSEHHRRGVGDLQRSTSAVNFTVQNSDPLCASGSAVVQSPGYDYHGHRHRSEATAVVKERLSDHGSPRGAQRSSCGECRHQPPTDSDRPTDCPEPAP